MSNMQTKQKLCGAAVVLPTRESGKGKIAANEARSFPIYW